MLTDYFNDEVAGLFPLEIINIPQAELHLDSAIPSEEFSIYQNKFRDFLKSSKEEFITNPKSFWHKLLITDEQNILILPWLLCKNQINNDVIDCIINSIKNDNDVASKEKLVFLISKSSNNDNLKVILWPKLVSFLSEHSLDSIDNVLLSLKFIKDSEFAQLINKQITSKLEWIDNLFNLESSIGLVLANKEYIAKELYTQAVENFRQLITNQGRHVTDQYSLALFGSVAEGSYTTEVLGTKLDSFYTIFYNALNSEVQIQSSIISKFEQMIMSYLSSNSSIDKVFEYVMGQNAKLGATLITLGYNFNEACFENILARFHKQPMEEHKYLALLLPAINIVSSHKQLPYVWLEHIAGIMESSLQNKVSTLNISGFISLFKQLSQHGNITPKITSTICIATLHPKVVLNDMFSNLLFEGLENFISKNHCLEQRVVNSIIIQLISEKNYSVKWHTRAIKLLQHAPNILDLNQLSALSEYFKSFKDIELNLEQEELCNEIVRLIFQSFISDKNLVSLQITQNLEQLENNAQLKTIISDVLKFTKSSNKDSVLKEIQSSISILRDVKVKPNTNIILKVANLNSCQKKEIQENKGERLLQNVSSLNPTLTDKITHFGQVIDEIIKRYEIYSNWYIDEIRGWVKNFKQVRLGKSKSFDIAGNEIIELICVIQRANNLHTTTKGTPHMLRETQIMALLLFIDNAQSKGTLLQVSTGEGKSTISTALSAIYALYGYHVDLITSSSVLAKDGCKQSKTFFQLLGITSAVNSELSKDEKIKPCYKAEVVFGDYADFHGDYLRNFTGNALSSRGGREFQVAILDEVDSLLIDGSRSYTRLSVNMPLIEYLSPLLIAAWNQFHQLILPHELSKEENIRITKEIIDSLIEQIPIPSHLTTYAKYQAPYWAVCLYSAVLECKLDIHYVVYNDQNGKKSIMPIDISTGVTRNSTQWQNGLHQFLEIKHQCQLTGEGLSGFFVTNLGYYKQYQRILGMTGTIGSEHSQKFLKTVYEVDLAYIPTFIEKKLIEQQTKLTASREDYINLICSSAYKEAYLNKRAVLLVANTIKQAEEIYQEFTARTDSSDITLIKYIRSEAEYYNDKVAAQVQPKTIIFATNLAGRGTDIRTSKTVEENGGLHVIATFIARNARDEEQVKGRTARQGNKGTYQLITLHQDNGSYEGSTILNIIGAGYKAFTTFQFKEEKEIIAQKKLLRDKQEKGDIEEAINKLVPRYLKLDEIHLKFSQLYSELYNSSSAKDGYYDPGLGQLIEDWSIWLKMNTPDDENNSLNPNIEEFLIKAKRQYQAHHFTNPIYQLTGPMCLGMKGIIWQCEFSKQLSHIDGFYHFAADYYEAIAYLSNDSETDKEYKIKAVYGLNNAQIKLHEVISYLVFTSMLAIEASQGDANNPFVKAINTKIEFLNIFSNHIKNAINLIINSDEDEIAVAQKYSKQELMPSLSQRDIIELNNLAIGAIYTLETYELEEDWGSSILTAVVGIFQVAVGTIITIGSSGLAGNIGVSIAAEGIRDLYNVVSAALKGQAVDLEKYFSNKAINYGLIAIQVGIDKIAQVKGIKDVGKLASNYKTAQGAKLLIETQTAQAIKQEVIKTIIKEAGLQVVKTIAIEEAAKLASKQIRNNVLDGLEDRIENSICKVAYDALLGQELLSDDEESANARQKLIWKIKTVCQGLANKGATSGIIKILSEGALKATYSLSTASTVLNLGHLIGKSAVEISKIDDLIEKVKDEIITCIKNFNTEFKTQQKNRKTQISYNMHKAEEIGQSLASEIAKLTARMICGIINCKVTTPIVTEGVKYSTDAFTKELQESLQEKRLQYTKALELIKIQELEQNGPLYSAAAGDEPVGFSLTKRKKEQAQEEQQINEWVNPDEQPIGSSESDKLTKEGIIAAVLITKAHQLGYGLSELNDDKILDHTSDVAALDLSILEYQEIARNEQGLKAVFAKNMAASLQSVREDIINGSTDFRSYIGEIKQNLLKGKTIHNVPGMGLDVAGNMIASVESRVGNLISNNLPNVKAAFGASLITAMEYGVEYAKGVFGEENIALVAQKLSQGKAFIDEHSTEGQRKAYEYILGAGIAELASKLVHAKPKLPDTLREYFKTSPLKASNLNTNSKNKFVLFSDNPANAIDPLTSKAVLASAEEIAIAEQELKAYLELEKNTIKLQHDAEKLIKDAHLKQLEGTSVADIIDHSKNKFLNDNPSNIVNPTSQNIAQYEKYKDYLREHMPKPIVKDEKLSLIMRDLYRDNTIVGSGSTAAALRSELITGNAVGGTFHLQKTQQYSNALQSWLNNNPTAPMSDIMAAENVLKDLQNALKGLKND